MTIAILVALLVLVALWPWLVGPFRRLMAGLRGRRTGERLGDKIVAVIEIPAASEPGAAPGPAARLVAADQVNNLGTLLFRQLRELGNLWQGSEDRALGRVTALRDADTNFGNGLKSMRDHVVTKGLAPRVTKSLRHLEDGKNWISFIMLAVISAVLYVDALLFGQLLGTMNIEATNEMSLPLIGVVKVKYLLGVLVTAAVLLSLAGIDKAIRSDRKLNVVLKAVLLVVLLGSLLYLRIRMAISIPSTNPALLYFDILFTVSWEALAVGVHLFLRSGMPGTAGGYSGLITPLAIAFVTLGGAGIVSAILVELALKGLWKFFYLPASLRLGQSHRNISEARENMVAEARLALLNHGRALIIPTDSGGQSRTKPPVPAKGGNGPRAPAEAALREVGPRSEADDLVEQESRG